MRSVLTIVAVLSYGVVFVFSCIGFLSVTTLLRQRLQTRHPEVWAQLGWESSGDVGLRRTAGVLWSWVRARSYTGLDDAVIARLASLLRFFGVAFMLCVVIAIAAILLDSLRRVL